jgi:hypothetical protein
MLALLGDSCAARNCLRVALSLSSSFADLCGWQQCGCGSKSQCQLASSTTCTVAGLGQLLRTALHECSCFHLDRSIYKPLTSALARIDTMAGDSWTLPDEIILLAILFVSSWLLLLLHDVACDSCEFCRGEALPRIYGPSSGFPAKSVWCREKCVVASTPSYGGLWIGSLCNLYVHSTHCICVRVWAAATERLGSICYAPAVSCVPR